MAIIMKKYCALFLISIIILCLTACSRPVTSETVVTEYKTEGSFLANDTTAAAKTTASEIKIIEKTVEKSDKQGSDKEKSDKKKSPTEKREKVKKTKPTTMPPTQGKTRPNTHVVVVRPTKGSFSSADLTFKHKGKTINLGDDIETVTKKFGEDYGLAEVSKTVTEYEYDSFTVGTKKQGKKEKVIYIDVLEDDVTTPKGVKIGMYASRLKRYYGDATRVTETQYIYGSTSRTLTFYYEDNIVTEFMYNLKQ